MLWGFYMFCTVIVTVTLSGLLLRLSPFLGALMSVLVSLMLLP